LYSFFHSEVLLKESVAFENLQWTKFRTFVYNEGIADNKSQTKLRKLIFILALILANISVFGQTFIGTSTDTIDIGTFNITIRINKDSTTNFIYTRDYQGIYGEYIGRIVKLDDTLYSISATMTIGQSCQKSFNLDKFSISLDKEIATQLDMIQFEYSDGKTRKQFRGYDSMGNPIRTLLIPVDKKLFNMETGMDFITITINRKQFLSDKFLTFKIPYGSASRIEAGRRVNFNVVIKNGELYTTDELLLFDEPFRLKITEE
jgi:hypothetical protein